MSFVYPRSILPKTPHRFVLSPVLSAKMYLCQTSLLNTDTPTLSVNYVKDKKHILKTTFKSTLVDVWIT